MIRLLFADDHVLFRQGLHRLLIESGQVEIVGECATGNDALETIRRLKPDVALLDISLPDRDGISIVSTLRAEGAQLPLIMLTMHDEPGWCHRALAAGANGHLLKDDAFEELMKAIVAVLEGRQYISRRLASRMSSTVYPAVSVLSPRELEVLHLICQGSTNRRIAEQLTISMKTVDTHRTKIMKKLNLHNTAELVRYAIDLGLA